MIISAFCYLYWLDGKIQEFKKKKLQDQQNNNSQADFSNVQSRESAIGLQRNPRRQAESSSSSDEDGQSEIDNNDDWEERW